MWLTFLGFTFIFFATVLLIRTVIFYFLLDHYLHSYVAGKPSFLFRGFETFNKPKEERIPPFSEKLKAGDILVRDFRDEKAKEEMSRKFETKDAAAAKVRVLTLNMEMGKQINKIIKNLTRIDADIILLQEVDVNTVRTGYVDIIGELAKALKMNSLFTVELVLPPDQTSQHLPKNCTYNSEIIGYEGNGILSKFDFVEARGLIVPCARIEKHRRKIHNEAMVVCDIPNRGLLNCYGVHLDTYGSSVTGRVEQYFNILKDVKAQKEKYEDKKITDKRFYQLIGGDMNTLCHGIIRCFPRVACDWYSTLGRVGYCEAGYFQTEAVEAGNKKFNLNLRDPFDKAKDNTFSSFKGLYQGKLDWLLLSENIDPTDTQICSINDKCSDHQWILVDAQLN